MQVSTLQPVNEKPIVRWGTGQRTRGSMDLCKHNPIGTHTHTTWKYYLLFEKKIELNFDLRIHFERNKKPRSVLEAQ